jgi:hypothetical protein
MQTKKPKKKKCLPGNEVFPVGSLVSNSRNWRGHVVDRPKSWRWPPPGPDADPIVYVRWREREKAGLEPVISARLGDLTLLQLPQAENDGQA